MRESDKMLKEEVIQELLKKGLLNEEEASVLRIQIVEGTPKATVVAEPISTPVVKGSKKSVKEVVPPTAEEIAEAEAEALREHLASINSKAHKVHNKLFEEAMRYNDEGEVYLNEKYLSYKVGLLVNKYPKGEVAQRLKEIWLEEKTLRDKAWSEISASEDIDVDTDLDVENDEEVEE